MIQKRLLDILDPLLVQQQFGFRPGKSTADAVFIARRAQEHAERSGTRFLMLALDYKRAFDSIPKTSPREALRRHRVPLPLTEIIIAIYDAPLFRVRDQMAESKDYTQDTGIRQGCPLSPLLFIAVTSMMFRDIAAETPEHYMLPRGLRAPSLLYADDTLLLATRPTDLTYLLHIVETHSLSHNLKLNREKCKLLVTNDDGVRLKFSDGTDVQKVDQLLYLGAWFHKHLDIACIVRRKFGETRGVMRQLQAFWRTWECTIPWKLRVFEAVVRAKLFYSMETLELTLSQQRLLDTFFYKALRRILKILTTFIARHWPNERVLRRARFLANGPEHANRAPKPTPFTEYYRKKRMKLLGHILRAPDNDLAKAAIILPNGLDLALNLPKRPGRPRQTWLASVQKEALQALPEGHLDPNEAQLFQLKRIANRRQPPFD